MDEKEEDEYTPSQDRADAGSPPVADTDNPVLELDAVFRALAHPRRRYLLYTLLGHDSGASLSDLATNIAAWEHDTPPAEVSAEARERVEVALYHAHIPKLVDLGVVTYDADTRIVTPAANATQVGVVLDGAGAELDQRLEAHARTNDTDSLP